MFRLVSKPDKGEKYEFLYLLTTKKASRLYWHLYLYIAYRTEKEILGNNQKSI